jgi:two-component system CheB/CheR fusion protein
MAKTKLRQAFRISPRQRAAEGQNGNQAIFPSENPNPVLRVNCQGIIQFTNQASMHLFANRKGMVGKKMPAVFHDPIKQATETGSKQEIEIKSGGRWFECTLAYVPEAGYINIYGRDITERKQAEEALRASEERYRLFMQNFQGIAY